MAPNYYYGIAGFFLLLTFILCLWGTLRLRQPNRQTAGSLSLLIMIFTWGISFAFSAAFVVQRVDLPPFVMGLYGLFIIVGTLCSLILAIVGLALWKGRPSGIERGKRSAVATLVVSTLILLFIAASAATRRHPEGYSDSRKTNHGSPKTVEVREKNFSISPGRSWIRLPEPKKVNSEACLAMRTSLPEIWAIAIAEEAPDLDMGLYIDVVRSNFRSTGLIPAPETETYTNSNGITFHHISASGTIHRHGKDLDLAYHSWLTLREGRAYQFVIWGSKATKNLETEAKVFIEQFQNLDNPFKESMTDINIPEWGIKTALEPLGWSDWNKDEEAPIHSLKAAKKKDFGFQVIPIRWTGIAPDAEAATAGLLCLLDMDYPSGVENRRSWTDSATGISGEDFDATTKLNGKEIRYAIRVARHGSNSWLIVAWDTGSPAGDEKALTEAIKATKLSIPTGGDPGKRPRTSALALNGAGLFLFSTGQYEKAEILLKQSAEQDPDDPVILGNRIEALVKLERHEDAIRALEAAPEATRKAKGIRGKHASLLVILERTLEADAIYKDLLNSDSLDDERALEWIRSLLDSGNAAPALEAAKSFAAARPSVKSRRWLAQTLSSNGNFKEALELMETLAKENPHQQDLRLDLAEMNNEASRPAEAEALLSTMISEGHDGFRTQAALGYSYMNRRWYRQAKTAFEAALKFSPDDANAKTALEECSALLGQGQNSAIKEPIKSVETPPMLVEKLSAMKPGPPDESDHARYLKHLVGWHFIPGKSLRQTSTRVIEILDASAVQDFSSLQFNFDPTFERIHPNRLEVFDSKGARVASGLMEDFYVLDTPGATADDGKTLHLPVPGLAAGHRIEVEVSREYLQAPKSFPFERLLFGSKLPISAEAVFLSGEIPSIQSRLSLPESVESFSDGKSRVWLAKPSRAYFTEQGAPDVEDYNPVLKLTGESSSWEDAGVKYLDQIRNLLKPPGKPLVDLVGKISQDNASEAVRATAIAVHVQRSINYHALEFGLRGRIPRSADETLKRKQGDCKDHAVLLHQMLSAAGIPSSLVLVNTNWQVDETLPTIDQFNHMIVHVPSLSPCAFVDPTSKASKPGELPPFGMANAKVLVLDPAKPYITSLPPTPDDCGSLKITRTVKSLEKGDLIVDENVIFTGYYAQWIREYLSGQPKPRQLAAVQKIFSGYGTSRIDSMEFPDPADPLPTAEMKLRYQIPPEPGGAGFLPMMWENDYLNLAFIKQREAPYQVRLPISIGSETTISAPDEFADDYVKSLNQKGSNDHCEWTSKASTSAARELKFLYQFKTLPKSWPADRYNDLREAWRTTLDAGRRKLEFQSGQ